MSHYWKLLALTKVTKDLSKGKKMLPTLVPRLFFCETLPNSNVQDMSTKQNQLWETIRFCIRYLFRYHIKAMLIDETYIFGTVSIIWLGPTYSVSGAWHGLTNTVSSFWQVDCFLVFQPPSHPCLVFTPSPALV